MSELDRKESRKKCILLRFNVNQPVVDLRKRWISHIFGVDMEARIECGQDTIHPVCYALEIYLQIDKLKSYNLL